MIPLKCLAVYKGRPALVTGTGEKISISAALSGGGCETLRVREKDIEVLHPGPLQSLAGLDRALSESGVRDAWELIESGGVPVSLRELAELAFGEFTPQSAWSAWHVLAGGLYFTGTVQALCPRPPAEVEAAEEKRREKARESRDRDAFLDRLREALRKVSPLDPGDLRFLQDAEALAWGRTTKSRTLKDLGRPETPQEAHRLLLETGLWDKGVNPHPRRFGLSLAPASGKLPPDRETERRDLTGLPAFAVDSPWSADPDDALSLECPSGGEGRRILYVHVADPAASVENGSPADLEARARGATLYLPEGTWRMLPEEALSRFALGLTETSPALSFKLTLAPAENSGPGAFFIEETEIFPSTIRVTRLSYEEADARAGGGGPESGLFRSFFALAEQNLTRRLNAGGVNIVLPEVHISAQAGDPQKVRIVPLTPFRSAEMVRECMLLAGEGTAAWAARRGLPFPCITQERGDLPAKVPEGLAGSWLLRRCMRPRSVSARPGCHWGLGLEGYTQVTSPLRRYTDILAHQQIRLYLQKEAGKGGEVLTEEEILLRLAAGDVAAQAVTQTERASKAHWTAVYLDALLAGAKAAGQREGPESRVWDAVVTERRGNNTGIIIPDLALETHLGGVAGSPNETIQVRLTSVRIPEAEAVFVRA